MSGPVDIRAATPADAGAIAVMVGELLTEIMHTIGEALFAFHLEESVATLEEFLQRGHYQVFVAEQADGEMLGFIALYESYALYAEGAFGTIPEFYVRPGHRSRGVGHGLAGRAKAFATARGWRRLEVTTPPLPAFQRTLAFYEREGFAVTGGRKLKLQL